MEFTYVTDLANGKTKFLTPFKRTKFEVISKTDDLVHSKIEYENGLKIDSKTYCDKIIYVTNMEFITKDGITYELRK
ncbi:hypothetical protein KPL26_03040 [Clostridium algidicarnis]|uniref:hypothetical protein n=1 Tax=Clostridium algidicarnis TaxID=37659 RepID=UPI001C0ACFCD|nr:hypothetical protein [Clostridium algidicarnis]MBU3195639.1 hypothetical protein [Clostridium algidicarnis]